MAKTPQGQLSKPFKTQYGWHVLEVLGRRATDSTEPGPRATGHERTA
jgi:peptidyl-prolyl cis-trans isomerase SurA